MRFSLVAAAILASLLPSLADEEPPCNICGVDGHLVTNPDIELDVPTLGIYSCAEMETLGQAGLPTYICDAAPAFVREPCGCEGNGTAAPTLPPCNVCGQDGWGITLPDVLLELEGLGNFTCGQLDQMAKGGIEDSLCTLAPFIVSGPCACEEIPICPAAVVEPSSNSHVQPQDGDEMSKVAFSSCFKPHEQTSAATWQHLRNNYGDSGSMFNWLGDFAYTDTWDQNERRIQYNRVKDDPYYAEFGPVAEPKIPTAGTWDDHDYAHNNLGNEYACRVESQNEWVYAMNLPETDPRHPAQGDDQQAGIYSSYMFKKPGEDTNGIHLINMDARYFRSPTLPPDPLLDFLQQGECEESPTMLGDEQWAWLEAELLRDSEIKLIASGIQILPPVARARDVTAYCAYDGEGGTFDQANTAVGEGPESEGTDSESWAEIPQERTRLLHMVQESINAGHAKMIIFLTGDQHYGELLAKEVPARDGQENVTLFEVTGSGIGVNAPEGGVVNSFRLQPDGSYPGVTDMVYSGAHACDENPFFICTAESNYAAVNVDWENNEVMLSVYTPHADDPVAAQVTISIPEGRADAAPGLSLLVSVFVSLSVCFFAV